MKTITLWSASILLAASAGTASAALTGTVSSKGSHPKGKPIKMDQDPKCKQLSHDKTVDNDVVVNGGKVEDAFVYVKAVPGSHAVPATPVQLDQKGCMYHPKVFGIMAKQKLEIINSDPTLHNIHAFSKRSEFNVGMPTQGQKIMKQFKKPEVLVPIKCDVHPWMHAWAGVTDNPFYAVTGADGSYSIAGLPDGEYEVVAAHGKLGEATQKVKISGGNGTADFSLK